MNGVLDLGPLKQKGKVKKRCALKWGGSGFIGSALTRALTNKGHQVTVISRNPGLNRITWSEVERAGLPDGCEAVINLAGQNIMDPTRRWTPGFKQNVWASRVNTTKALANAICLAKTKPKVFATISGVGYYEPSLTETYTEDSRGGKDNFLSQLCADWEAAAALPDNVNVRKVTIRTGVVLGRDGGIIKYLIWPFFFGLGGPVAAGTQWLPWIHIKDLVSLFVFIVENNHVNGILNGIAPHAVTNAEFSKCFAHQMWRPAIIPFPLFLAELVYGKERANIVTQGQKVIPKRTLETGFEFTYPNLNSACEEFAKLIYADTAEHLPRTK